MRVRPECVQSGVQELFEEFCADGGNFELGERDGTRTHDLLIKSQLLYRLSYALVTRRMIPASENSGPMRRPGV